MIRVLEGINAFFGYLTAVHPLPAFLAVCVHLARLACTSTAWCNVLRAAYPRQRVRRLPILGAYLAGVGINAVVPVRAGDAVRVVLAHRSIKDSTYTTVVSSSFVLSIFDIAASSLLLLWASTTQDALPRVRQLPTLRSFDFSWLIEHPLVAELFLAALLVVLALVGVWVAGHVADFWARVRQAFAVVRQPALYFRTVVPWQAADWALRIATIWLLLDAFGIPQTFRYALLVQVSSSVATLLPLTPAGIGTEQAFLLYVFRGAVASSQLLAFSVGMKLTIVSTNVVAGFTAIFLTLRTVRYQRALEHAKGPPSIS